MIDPKKGVRGNKQAMTRGLAEKERDALEKLAKATPEQKERFDVLMRGFLTNLGPDKYDEILAEVRRNSAQYAQKESSRRSKKQPLSSPSTANR